MKGQEWIDRFVIALGKSFYASLAYKQQIARDRLIHLSKDIYSPEQNAHAYLDEIRDRVRRCAAELSGGPAAFHNDHLFRDEWTKAYIAISSDPPIALEALIACGALMSPEEAADQWTPDPAYCPDDAPTATSPSPLEEPRQPTHTRVEWVDEIAHLVVGGADISEKAYISKLAERMYDDFANVPPTIVAGFLQARLKNR
jgi:hypothetical protein